MTSFYTEQELQEIGLLSYGKNVYISRKVSIYSPNKISIGNNVRIDDFCILSGNINLGSNIHISAYCALYGANTIVMEDYTGLSPKCVVFSAMDDFSGNYLIGPIYPINMTNVIGGLVRICKYAQVGAGCIIFPNLIVNEGAVVGSMSLVRDSLESWSINVGIPAKKIKNRTKNLLRFIYE